MINQALTIALAIGVAACSSSEPQGSDDSNQIAFHTTDTTYFSAELSNTYQVDRFAGTLRSMHEPSFHHATVPVRTTALRFFWRRSFHPHVAIRVEIAPNSCHVVTTTLGPGEFDWSAPDSLGTSVPLRYRPGLILRNDSARVPVPPCIQLANEFEKAERWILAATPYGPAPDGSDWMFEILTPSGHRAVSRFSPDSIHAPEVWRAGVEALRLGRALPPEAERYE